MHSNFNPKEFQKNLAKSKTPPLKPMMTLDHL